MSFMEHLMCGKGLLSDRLGARLSIVVATAPCTEHKNQYIIRVNQHVSPQLKCTHASKQRHDVVANEGRSLAHNTLI